MILNKEQFSKLREIDRLVRNELSIGTREAILGLEITTTSSIYNTQEEEYADCNEGTLALADVNECCVRADSTILRELADYYGLLADLIEAAEKESNQPPVIEYSPVSLRINIMGNEGGYYEQFINLFRSDNNA